MSTISIFRAPSTTQEGGEAYVQVNFFVRTKLNSEQFLFQAS